VIEWINRKGTAKMRSILVSLLLFTLIPTSFARQQSTQPGSVEIAGWPEGFDRVEIRSSLDNEMQPAIFRASASRQQKPLLVSLHSWSGDYTQKDTLAYQIAELDWNYIHPDFRGPNRTPKACGSRFVISDIEDAIDYAQAHARVDPDQIHVIGASGGGHATLLAYMAVKKKIRSFSAWVAISNLVDWYWESLGRDNKYAGEILAATSSDSSLNVAEAMARSPYYWPWPVSLRRDAELTLYAGIHDGYTGSVPITQSLRFYNRVVREMAPGHPSALIPEHDMIELLSKRNYAASSSGGRLGGREIHYSRALGPVRLIIFEGSHELLPDAALQGLPITTRPAGAGRWGCNRARLLRSAFR